MTGSTASHPSADSSSALVLLDRARRGNPQHLGRLLELYRNYLKILATSQLDARLRRRLSPSDVVQEAMLGAYRDFEQFRGTSERAFLAWLRQILIHSLHHAYETHILAGRRNLRREVSLHEVDRSLDRSAVRLANVLVDQGQSPSGPLRDRERAVAIADQLAQLRPDYRDVIVLRNLQGLSFDEIAQHLNRQSGAVRMLWLRAIEKFRQSYESNA